LEKKCPFLGDETGQKKKKSFKYFFLISGIKKKDKKFNKKFSVQINRIFSRRNMMKNCLKEVRKWRCAFESQPNFDLEYFLQLNAHF